MPVNFKIAPTPQIQPVMSSLSQHPKMLHFAQALAQLGLLFMIWLIGTAIQKWLQLPISGGVIGLLLLLAALLAGVFKLQWIKRGTDLILAELMLFFIPCVVGLIKYQHLFVTQGWQLIMSVVSGTVCVMAVTAYAVHLGFKLEVRLKQNSQGQKNQHPSGSKMAHGE